MFLMQFDLFLMNQPARLLREAMMGKVNNQRNYSGYSYL